MAGKLFTKLDPKKKFTALFQWESPERHWTPKDRAWFISYGFFFVLIITVLALLEEFILIVAIIAFVFLWFTQASVPPSTVEHTITSLGVKTFGKVFKWRNIKHYWFSKKYGIYYLNLEVIDQEFTTNERIHTVSLLINQEDIDTIFYTLLEYIDYGDRDEIQYNIIVKILQGNHIDIAFFLEESQEEYLEKTGKPKPSFDPEIRKKQAVKNE